MTAYAAGRDVMRMRNADWHDKYTLPSLIDFYTPNRALHGAYFYDWTTEDEIAWRNFYQVWFRLLNDYKKMGGRVTASDDAAFIYNTYGFGNIHEMELLQEAGFHPLEVIQAATYNPALTIAEAEGKPMEFGVVRVGMLADMIVVDQNPLKNLKVLYGTGAVRRTIRPGALSASAASSTRSGRHQYDAKKLLADIARWSRSRNANAQRRARLCADCFIPALRSLLVVSSVFSGEPHATLARHRCCRPVPRRRDRASHRHQSRPVNRS
jgi:hypothetical protein